MAKIRTRKRGTKFSYIFEAGKAADGKRKVVEKGGYPSEREAYEAGVAAFNDWKHGNIGVTSESITLKDFIDIWLKKVVLIENKPNTYLSYKSIVKSTILPYLGNLTLQEIKPAHIDNWLRVVIKKGFAKRTISTHRQILNIIFQYAIYPCELITFNPVSVIHIPKSMHTEKKIKREVIPVSKFNELIEKYPFGNKLYIPLLIAYYTGLRIGEICGLSWNDIDFEKQLLNVDHQEIYLPNEGYLLSTPKTLTSIRTIYIGDFLINQLKKWKQQQQLNEKNQGNAYIINYTLPKNRQKIISISKDIEITDEYIKFPAICTDHKGKLLHSPVLSYHFRKEGINAHSFRHTHATILMEQGASPRSVAARLGHCNTSITYDLYTHITDKMQQDTVDIFENYAASKNKMQTSKKRRQNADKTI